MRNMPPQDWGIYLDFVPPKLLCLERTLKGALRTETLQGPFQGPITRLQSFANKKAARAVSSAGGFLFISDGRFYRSEALALLIDTPPPDGFVNCALNVSIACFNVVVASSDNAFVLAMPSGRSGYVSWT